MEKLRVDKKNRWFASRGWYASALVLLIWAILQEIIMSSTDLVDNFFANTMKRNVDGATELNQQIKAVFGAKDIYQNAQVWQQWNLPFDAEGYNVTAGQLAMNGVTASNQIFTIMFAVLSGFCYGFGVYSSQYYGAGRYNELRQITTMKLYVCLFITTMLFILGFIEPVTRWMINFTTNYKYVEIPSAGLKLINANESELANKWFDYFQSQAAKIATDQGVEYYQIVSLSYPLLAINLAFITTLRETGRPLIALWMAIISLVTNCLMNLMLIEPNFLGEFKGLGIKGTAIATACSRVLQIAFLAVLLGINRYDFIPRWKNFTQFEPLIIVNAFKKAWPITLNELLWAVGMVVQVKLKSEYSVETLTANSIFSTIQGTFFSPLYHGFSVGASVMIGNRLGANELSEAEYNGKHLVNLSFVFGIVFGLSLAAVSFYLPEWLFSNSNSETFRIAHYMLLIYGLMYPLMILASVTYAIIRTGGAVYSAMLMDSVFTWLVPVPILAGSIYGTKLDIVYIVLILQLTDAVKTVWSLILFNQKKWVKNLTYSINISSKPLVKEEIEQIIVK